MTLPKSFLANIINKSSHSTFFHGSLIVRAGNIKAIGYNKKNGCHAEASALKKMWPSEIQNCSLVSIRMTAGGQLAQAKPCPNCMILIKKAGIKKVFYSTSERKLEMERI